MKTSIKHLLLIFLVVVVITLLFGCSHDHSRRDDTNGANEDILLITHENNPLLELARQGRIDHIDFGIGSSTETIIEEWGLPDKYDYFMGGLYFRYDDKKIFFLTGAELDNGEITHDEVGAIGFSDENKVIYNVRIGMTFEEIIAVLGEPTNVNSPEENEESEHLLGNWAIVYDTGEHEVEFVSKTEKGPVIVVYLWRKN